MLRIAFPSTFSHPLSLSLSFSPSEVSCHVEYLPPKIKTTFFRKITVRIIMGRSQVERNRAARGRGRGRGRGSRGSVSVSGGGGSRSASGAEGRREDSNSFRYFSNDERIRTGGDDGAAADNDMNWLFDESAFDGGFNNFFAQEDEEDVANGSEILATKILRSMIGRETTQQQQQQQQQQGESVKRRSIISSIDIKQLNECFKQIPIHTRLRLPHYIGRHLEDRYGLGVRPTPPPAGAAGGGGRENTKKTLAQLREESRCIIRDGDDIKFEGLAVMSDDDNDAVVTTVSKLPLSGEGGETTTCTQVGGGALERAVGGGGAVAFAGGEGIAAADDNEEDLEAWLDDMIA